MSQYKTKKPKELHHIASRAAKSVIAIRQKRNMMDPRIKSMKHLSHEGSETVNNPLAILASHAIDIWNSLKRGISKLKKKIYPKKRIIYGERSDGSLIGWISFSQKEDSHLPIHHMHCELWGRTRFGKWKMFSQGDTDREGVFNLPYDMKAIHGNGIRKLKFEIYQTKDFTIVNGKAVHVNHLFKTLKVPLKNLTGMEYDLGMIQLKYWEYRTDTLLPRVIIKDHDKDTPEEYAPGFLETIEKQFIPVELTTRKHLRKIKEKDNGGLTIEKIQSDYPENLTIHMEKESKGVTRSDEWFGMRFMNGMFASNFDKDPDNPELYWVYYHWKTYDQENDVYAMPNIGIKFKLEENGYMLPVSIDLSGKLRKDGEDEKVTITPKDGHLKWNAAKRAARVSAGLATQIDRHFAQTHVNVEQISIAASRNIRRNPVGAILFPHLKEVTLVNHTADRILINDGGYITQATAISGKGLSDRVMDVLGTLDWKNWIPMKPVSDQHTYARAANLFYDILTKYVGEFIDDHEKEIISEWHEIYRLSSDLVDHSVPKFLCGYLKNKLKIDKKGHLQKSPENDWYNKSNRMDLTLDRPNFHFHHAVDIELELDPEDKRPPRNEEKEVNIERAFSHITEDESYDPSKKELENLKQFCAYAIFQATLGHFWSNSKQYDDIGELRYNTLGLRFGDSKEGILGSEDDDSIAPDLKICTQTMWWANMLSRTGYGFIMKNEENDIPSRLINLLKENEKQFAEFDLDISEIQSRTNI